VNIKKRKIIIGAVVIALSIAVFSNWDIINAIILGSERIGFYEISAMRTARTNNEANIILIRNNTEVQFPLPNGAAEFDNEIYQTRDGTTQFLVTTEAFRHYVDILLPQNGLTHDQLGALHIITNENMRVDIITSMFTRNFMKIVVYTVEP